MSVSGSPYEKTHPSRAPVRVPLCFSHATRLSAQAEPDAILTPVGFRGVKHRENSVKQNVNNVNNVNSLLLRGGGYFI